MEKIIKQGLLYDFYGALLNEHQREIYEAYVYDNMSLSEIAEEQGISRQGVHDLLKRCDKSLEDYENKLHLVEKFMMIRDGVEKIESESDIEKIRSIAERMLAQL
ncbi:MAG: YlxM family DNA-binding protein [Lachnospiraceae bacterium]|nr:YlxM family DNA-binding protein [Lachnospiraceae bacterium]